MKTVKLITYLIPLLLTGCSQTLPIKQFELSENRVVHTGEEYSKQLFETSIDTKGYKTLRIFAHINNQEYRENPIPIRSKFEIVAYYGIGNGSWGYFSKTFHYKSTSGWGGVADIPIVGEKTRISVHTSKMKNIELEVDVVATLFN